MNCYADLDGSSGAKAEQIFLAASIKKVVIEKGHIGNGFILYRRAKEIYSAKQHAR